MHKLTINQIIAKIKKEEAFSCLSEDSSFFIAIEEYTPFICTAIHNGGNLRKELRDKSALSKFERWQEEDPYTGEFISSLPIRLIGYDSRYEYDLNRSPDECIYDEAWGKPVWTKKLLQKEKNTSLKKHAAYYKVLKALITKLESKFKSCLVFDIHSYNGNRENLVEAPLFNLGTKNIKKKYRPYVDFWLEKLRSIDLPFIENNTAENKVFFGKGYQVKFVGENFKNTLVLATEIRKCYLDEESGDIFPEVINSLKEEFKRTITEQTKFFANEVTNVTIKKRHKLLGSEIEPIVLDIDRHIYKLLKNFDVLNFVSPTNIESERKRFFKSKLKKPPEFKYRPLKLDAMLLKRELYTLPINEISDVTIQNLYQEVIESYCDQIDLLSNRDDHKFLYSSLKYYGEPSDDDKKIAQFFLSAPNNSFSVDEKVMVDHRAVETYSQEMIEKLGLKGKIVFAHNMAANAAFSPNKNLLKIKTNCSLNDKYAKALAHHEIGVHMLTTENSRLQKLSIFQLGLPLDTKTQEGLAILSEYLSGHMTVTRLKELALRVLTVAHMVKNYDFRETFTYLLEELEVEENAAFRLCTRIYRGGGFTKDYLYLRGFKEIYNFYQKDKDSLNSLLIGKASIEYLAAINELTSRELLFKPKYLPVSFKGKRKDNGPVVEYLMNIFKDHA